MGSPLSVVVFGVSDLDESTAFYRDVIGLDATEETHWSGDDFDSLWQLPPGSSARTRLFSLGDSPVGRILAVEFDAPDRKTVPLPDERTYRAFWNINLYVSDIYAAVEYLKKQGCRIWSEPFEYIISDGMGGWTEAVIIGPDNATTVLLELPQDVETKVGVVGIETDVQSKTKAGFSQIATTSHSVSSFDKALSFYRDVVGMEPIIEEVMSDVALNRLNSRPDDGQTRWAFIKGDHFLGKVVISYPMNYSVPDRTSVAVPPNIGYLAQGFTVPNLADTAAACVSAQADVFSPSQLTSIPGIGEVETMIVRNPGSGGLTLLFTEPA